MYGSHLTNKFLKIFELIMFRFLQCLTKISQSSHLLIERMHIVQCVASSYRKHCLYWLSNLKVWLARVYRYFFFFVQVNEVIILNYSWVWKIDNKKPYVNTMKQSACTCELCVLGTICTETSCAYISDCRL